MLPRPSRKFLKNRFQGFEAEYFLDGLGNKEKHKTSIARLDRDSAIYEATVVVNNMETLAEKGQGIKSTAYKTVQRNLQASVPFSETIKKELVAAMKKKRADEETIKIHHVQGEADLAIRSRARELATSTQLVVEVGNDADYCLGPEIKWLLRPRGSRYIEYYKDAARVILQRYYKDPKVVAASAAYTRDNRLPRKRYSTPYTNGEFLPASCTSGVVGATFVIR
ncbi:hypothetical protein DFQ27_000708 [Actinomortierella ambigua]|uniref:Uncharacterized protein n=1 Tax=Actinomortierella ambigua TaxID=1343610 RepID=A0A9P6PM59_9FUNG|nr:hypothetical protein DFQ27_000708 [Actinomortierella ambigua]